MCVAKAVFTFGYHRMGITPDPYFPILAKLTNNCLKRCYSVSVVFKKKQRFHLCRIYSFADCTGSAESGTSLFVSPK